MADEMTHVTEKVYCYDHPSAYSNNNNHDSLLCSMMNNNQWSNNPWMYLIFLSLFGRGFGYGGADVAQNADLSRQIQGLTDVTNTNQSTNTILSALNGNREAIGQLAQTFNTDLGNIQTAICNVKSAIEQVGGQVGYSAESVKNAIALGDSNIMSKMQECCCQQKTAILEQGYQNQLATERQTNVLSSQIADFKAADQLQTCQQTSALNNSINDVRQAVVNGFANIGYQNSQNTAQIIQTSQQNTQRILDQMCANTTQELRDKLAQMSQDAQTAQIIAGLKNSGCNCCSC